MGTHFTSSLLHVIHQCQFKTQVIAFADTECFYEHLATRDLAQTTHPLAETESTQILARNYLIARGTSAHGVLFLTEVQTKGIGRRSRTWKGDAKGNLYFSFIWVAKSLRQVKTKVTMATKAVIEEVQLLNFAVPLAVAIACEKLGEPML